MLPFLSLGELPDPGIEPASLALASRFFTTEPPRNLCISIQRENCRDKNDVERNTIVTSEYKNFVI